MLIFTHCLDAGSADSRMRITIYIASRGRVGCYNWHSTEGGISCQIPLSLCTKRSRPPTKSSVLTSSVSLSMSMVIAETFTTGPAIVIKLLTGRPSDHGPYCALLPADQVRRRSDDDSTQCTWSWRRCCQLAELFGDYSTGEIIRQPLPTAWQGLRSVAPIAHLLTSSAD